MSTRQYLFGPLVEVPSDHLEKGQDAWLDQRGSGADNTLAVGLDAASPSHRAYRTVVCLPQAAFPGPNGVADLAIDYRDRLLVVDYQMDPTRDIRPGEVSDSAFPLWRGTGLIYTRVGNAHHRFAGNNFTLFIDPTTGRLEFTKTVGFVVLTLRASCQLKERS